MDSERLFLGMRVGFTLGWEDVKQQYRRSAIGPFWLTISMAIQIVTMGLVFSLIFKITLNEYLPFIAGSMILWSFFSNSVLDGCNSLVSSAGIIRQTDLPYFLYTVRVMWKNVATLGHNLIILPPILLIFSSNVSLNMLLAVPGFLLMLVNLAWISTFLGLVCARYRDFYPIVSSVITIFYFITPIMWMPTSLGNGGLAHLLLGLNPVYHIFQIVRQPLLGQSPTTENWLAAALIALVGISLTWLVSKKFSSYVPFWV